MKNKQKILEIGFEGGDAKIFKFIDKKNNKEWFFFSISDMGSEDINGVEYENNFSMSFPEVIFRMLEEHKYALSNYPLYIDKNYKNVMVEILKEYQKIDGNDINKSQWSIILDVNQSELEWN